MAETVTISGSEHRKKVCRALTNVLVESKLGERFNPQAFYMLLSSNFAVLSRPEGIDLTPIWGSLYAQVGNDSRLPGLFLAFQNHLASLGINAIVPPQLATIASQDRSRAVSAAFSIPGTPEEAVVEEIPVADLRFETGEMPILDPSELLPLVPQSLSSENRREVTLCIIQNLRKAPFGPRLDASQLAFRLDKYFDQICDGQTLDLTPLLESLQSIEGFSFRDVYPSLVAIEQRIAEFRLGLRVPDLGISAEEGAKLVAEAEDREKAAQTRPSPIVPRGTPPPPESGKKPPSTLRRDRVLRHYGLLGLSSKQWQVIRVVLLLGSLGALAVFGWLTRPNRPLRADEYALPLTSAGVRAGIFVGTLNDRLWYSLKESERTVVLSQFEEQIKSTSVGGNARVIDRHGRVVIKATANGTLVPSKFVLKSPDGVQPPTPGKARNPREFASDRKL